MVIFVNSVVITVFYFCYSICCWFLGYYMGFSVFRCSVFVLFTVACFGVLVWLFWCLPLVDYYTDYCCLRFSLGCLIDLLCWVLVVLACVWLLVCDCGCFCLIV